MFHCDREQIYYPVSLFPASDGAVSLFPVMLANITGNNDVYRFITIGR
jgi:hypothetical protein